MVVTARDAARTALACVAVVEGAAALRRHGRRTEQYQEARTRARELKRPLLVVGDPDAGLHTKMYRAYGCGDICLDLTECPTCPTGLGTDLTTERIPLRDGAVVVFVGCTLEYVGDVEPAIAEINRVAGGADNVFMANVQPWCLTAWLYPGARRLVHESGSTREISGAEKGLVLGGLGLLCYVAL